MNKATLLCRNTLVPLLFGCNFFVIIFFLNLLRDAKAQLHFLAMQKLQRILKRNEGPLVRAITRDASLANSDLPVTMDCSCASALKLS